MDRFIVWHIPYIPYLPSLPAFYLGADYSKGAVRIYAETPPQGNDLKVDILADGVSIFNDHASQLAWIGDHEPAPPHTPDTSVGLSIGETTDTEAADFTNGDLTEGTWMTLSVVDLASARNVTVQLELIKLSEDEETEEE